MSTKSYFENFQLRVKVLQQEIQELLKCDKNVQLTRTEELDSSFLSLCEETSSKQLQLTAYERRKINLFLDELQEGIKSMKDKLKPQTKLCWDVSDGVEVSQEAPKIPEDKVWLPSSQQIETIFVGNELFVVENLIDDTRNFTDSFVNADQRALDVRFSNCVNCCLCLKSWARDCNLKGLRNCQVMLGPVQTVVYIEECMNCVICVAAQQIRIHDCQKCTFRVQSKQGSILERSKDIVFGPYTYHYPGIEEDFHKVGLLCEKDSWRKVRDFQFLLNRKQKHWKLEENDENNETVQCEIRK